MNLKITKIVLLGTFLFPFCSAYAQSIQLEDVQQAIQLAKERNADYQVYQLNQNQADLDYKQSRKHRLPTISGSFSGQKNISLATTPLPGEIFGQPGQVVETQFGQEYNYNAGITISKQLLSQQARMQVKLSEIDRQLMASDQSLFGEYLAQSVSLYYYSLIIAIKAVEVGEEDLKSAKQIAQLSAEKYQEGIIDQISYNKAQINQQSVNQNLIANKRLVVQNETELKKLLGLGLTDSLEIVEKLTYDLPDYYKADQLLPSVIDQNASLQLSQAESQVKWNQAAKWPTLSLNSYYGKQQFRDDGRLSLDGDDWSNYSYLTLNLSIPIFSGFSTKTNIKKSKINVEIAEKNRDDTWRQSVLEDHRLISEYALSLEESYAARNTFQLQEENQKINQAKYEEGIISLDEYLSSFEDYLQSENAFLNAVSRLYSNYSQIITRTVL